MRSYVRRAKLSKDRPAGKLGLQDAILHRAAFQAGPGLHRLMLCCQPYVDPRV